MKLGFVGLGNMGQAMARNLLRAGHDVAVYNRTRQKAEDLVSEGAKVAGSPAEACGGEAVCTMVADDHALEEVVFGPSGILAAQANELIHLSMSTISTSLAKRLSELHRNEGKTYVAAP